MKKLFLVLLAMAVVGAFAFAEVTGPDAPTVSGSVTTQFGINLDTVDADNEDAPATGFDNSSSVDVVVPLAGGSDTHSGSGDIWAEITIEDIEISLSTDDEDVSYDADVSAKLHMGDLYVGLGHPGLDFNMVDLDADIQNDGEVDDDTSVDANCPELGVDGISIGYMTDAFSFEVGVASKVQNFQDADDAWATGDDEDTDWLDSNEDDADDSDAVVPNYDNEYVFGFNASVTAGPATVPVYFSYDPTFGYDALEDEDLTFMAFGTAPSVMAGDLTLDVPFDYMAYDEQTAMEAKPALTYAIADVGSISADFFYAAYTDVEDVDSNAIPETIMEAGLVFTEAMMDELTLVVDFDLCNLADSDNTADDDDLGWNVNVDASYDVGAAVPYMVLDYGSNEDMDLSVGAKFPTLIDNACVKVDYTNGHLLESGDEDDGDLDEADSGTITLEIAVTF